MASFKVLQEFSVPADAQTKHLEPGGVYLVGHDISGLTAAEAAELLKLAPEGTFQPLDAEGETVATYVLRVSGRVDSSGSTEVQ